MGSRGTPEPRIGAIFRTNTGRSWLRTGTSSLVTYGVNLVNLRLHSYPDAGTGYLVSGPSGFQLSCWFRKPTRTPEGEVKL